MTQDPRIQRLTDDLAICASTPYFEDRMLLQWEQSPDPGWRVNPRRLSVRTKVGVINGAAQSIGAALVKAY